MPRGGRVETLGLPRRAKQSECVSAIARKVQSPVVWNGQILPARLRRRSQGGPPPRPIHGLRGTWPTSERGLTAVGRPHAPGAQPRAREAPPAPRPGRRPAADTRERARRLPAGHDARGRARCPTVRVVPLRRARRRVGRVVPHARREDGRVRRATLGRARTPVAPRARRRPAGPPRAFHAPRPFPGATSARHGAPDTDDRRRAASTSPRSPPSFERSLDRRARAGTRPRAALSRSAGGQSGMKSRRVKSAMSGSFAASIDSRPPSSRSTTATTPTTS